MPYPLSVPREKVSSCPSKFPAQKPLLHCRSQGQLVDLKDDKTQQQGGLRWSGPRGPGTTRECLRFSVT